MKKHLYSVILLLPALFLFHFSCGMDNEEQQPRYSNLSVREVQELLHVSPKPVKEACIITMRNKRGHDKIEGPVEDSISKKQRISD